jgi:hypothetical protein
MCRLPWLSTTVWFLAAGGMAGAHAQSCYQWIRRTDVGTPGNRAGMAMAYDVDRRVTVFFGGDLYGNNEESFFDNTWEYDGVQWKQITIEGAVPVRRSNAAMAYDETAHCMIMVGGDNHDGELADTWAYRSTGPGRGRWDYLGEVGSVPFGTGKRTGASLTYAEHLRTVVLAGGRLEHDGDEYIQGDVKYWTGSEWRDLGNGLLRPLDFGGIRRYGLAWHGAAYDSDLDQLVLYKGLIGCAEVNENCNTDANDESDLAFVIWSSGDQPRVWPMSASFPKLQQTKLVYDTDRHRFIALGGFNFTEGDDILDPDITFIKDAGSIEAIVPVTGGQNPYRIAPPRVATGGLIGQRLRFGAVYDRHRKRLVLYGGGLGERRFDDTWELVASEPLITFQPQALSTHCVGEALRIEAFTQTPAAGMDEHSFQWFRDGIAVPERPPGSCRSHRWPQRMPATIT